jgi:putative transposase
VGAHPFDTVNSDAENRAGTRPAPTVGDVVGTFKSITTHQYTNGVRQHNWPPFNGKLWQRNYYEHIIRSEKEMDRIRKYIVGNPTKWIEDEDNPSNIIYPRGGSYRKGGSRTALTNIP